MMQWLADTYLTFEENKCIITVMLRMHVKVEYAHGPSKRNMLPAFYVWKYVYFL